MANARLIEIAWESVTTTNDIMIFNFASSSGVTTLGKWTYLNFSNNTIILGALAPTKGNGVAATIPIAGTFKTAIINSSLVNPAGAVTMTLSVNGADSTLAVSMAAGALEGTNYTDSVHVNAGDYVCWHFGPGGTDWTRQKSISIAFYPD